MRKLGIAIRARIFVPAAFVFVVLALPLFAPWVLAQNTPPVADAGPDQTIYLGDTTYLEGSAFDPDGNDIAAWLWTVESSPAGSSPYFNPAHPHSSFSADIAGDFVLSLVVSDGMVWSLPDYVTIYVLEILPPVAIATADVTSGPAPLTVNFDGSQSYDPQGGTLTYDWSFGDGWVSTEVSPTHVYQNPGVYSVALTVFDDLGQSGLDYFEIVVTSPQPPVPEFPLGTVLLTSLALCAYLAAARWRKKQIT